jgi:hypothetical protein
VVISSPPTSISDSNTVNPEYQNISNASVKMTETANPAYFDDEPFFARQALLKSLGDAQVAICATRIIVQQQNCEFTVPRHLRHISHRD